MAFVILVYIVLGFLQLSYWRFCDREVSNKGGIQWEANPQYSSDIGDNDNQYPSWLHDRMDIIYDSSCIKKENKLGAGHFGTVHLGKILLGNAVYVLLELRIQELDIQCKNTTDNCRISSDLNYFIFQISSSSQISTR